MAIRGTLQGVRTWVQDAVADGWRPEPIYSNEPIETATKLTKDGFSAHVILRSDRDASIAVWAPDQLQVNVPEKYSFQDLSEATLLCDICKQKVEKTVRLAFANRCCPECRKKPEVLRKYEYPGWCD